MNNENLRKIINLRHELHEHPELSGHESETKRRLMNFLENNTRLAVVDCGKWFYASRYVEGTKAIAFRADMDALPMDETISVPYASRNPSVSHKCGHDGHSAALCGLGLELSRLDVKRSVYLLFQHAEETGQGARECSGFLRERSISEIYAFHNWSGWPEKSIVVKKGV
ncbi:MAG: amidohydrolase, partial [Synergistaceae bacterium]|nr:amidohydrolase [Synergistaceae bacterium]